MACDIGTPVTVCQPPSVGEMEGAIVFEPGADKLEHVGMGRNKPINLLLCKVSAISETKNRHMRVSLE